MIEDKWITLIKKVVHSYIPDQSYRVFIFGSRAEGTSRRWSDVDIGLLGPKKIDLFTILAIKEDLQESDLPYRVDVVDFSSASKDFTRVAAQNVIYL